MHLGFRRKVLQEYIIYNNIPRNKENWLYIIVIENDERDNDDENSEDEIENVVE